MQELNNETKYRHNFTFQSSGPQLSWNQWDEMELHKLKIGFTQSVAEEEHKPVMKEAYASY